MTPVPYRGPQPPTPVVTAVVPGDGVPLPAVEANPPRIGYFDRPNRLFARRR